MIGTIMKSAALLLYLAAANVVYPAPQRRTATLHLAGTSCCGAPIYILAGCHRAYNSTMSNKTQSEECNDSGETKEDQCEESFMFHDLNCSSPDAGPHTNRSIEDTGNIFSNYTVSNDTSNDRVPNIPDEEPTTPNVQTDKSDKNVTKTNPNRNTRQCYPVCRLSCSNSSCRSLLRTRCCCHSNSASAMASGNCCCCNNPVSRLNAGTRPSLLCNSGNGPGGNNITSNINYIKGGNLLCCSGNGPGPNRIQSVINVISGDSSLISSGDITLLQSLCNLFIGQNCSMYDGPEWCKGNRDLLTNASVGEIQQLVRK